MTKDSYNKYHSRPQYVGRHEKKWYNVWRVLGPAGPEERFPVYGLDEAREAIKGCWDYEVTTTNMEVVNI